MGLHRPSKQIAKGGRFGWQTSYWPWVRSCRRMQGEHSSNVFTSILSVIAISWNSKTKALVEDEDLWLFRLTCHANEANHRQFCPRLSMTSLGNFWMAGQCIGQKIHFELARPNQTASRCKHWPLWSMILLANCNRIQTMKNNISHHDRDRRWKQKDLQKYLR